MSESQFRRLGRSEQAHITACGKHQVVTPFGYADVFLISDEHAAEAKKVADDVE